MGNGNPWCYPPADQRNPVQIPLWAMATRSITGTLSQPKRVQIPLWAMATQGANIGRDCRWKFRFLYGQWQHDARTCLIPAQSPFRFLYGQWQPIACQGKLSMYRYVQIPLWAMATLSPPFSLMPYSSVQIPLWAMATVRFWLYSHKYFLFRFLYGQWQLY